MALSKCGHFILRPIQSTLVFLGCDAPSEKDVTDVGYRAPDLFALRNAEDSPAPETRTFHLDRPTPDREDSGRPAEKDESPGFESARRIFGALVYSAIIPAAATHTPLPRRALWSILPYVLFDTGNPLA